MLPIQILIQAHNKHRVTHIDESVAHITIVLQVNWQVEEVVAAGVRLINPIQQHLLGILVWDILDHYCGALVMSVDYLSEVQMERLFPLVGLECLRLESRSEGNRLQGEADRR